MRAAVRRGEFDPVTGSGLATAAAALLNAERLLTSFYSGAARRK